MRRTHATHVVNSSSLSPNFHIRTLCALSFTRAQPSFDLSGKLVVGDLGLSVKYGFELESHIVCQQRHCQVSGSPRCFLRSRAYVSKKENIDVDRTPYQLLVIFNGHEGGDSRCDIYHLRLLVRRRQDVVPFINELSRIGFFTQAPDALIGGEYTQKTRQCIGGWILGLCQSENFYGDDGPMLLELFEYPC